MVIPSYTNDLKGLNEAGIRHDIRKEIELGFGGTLLVSEVAITLDEYGQFFEWSHDEAKGKLKLIHHAMFDTLEENIEAAQIAEANGAELVLLCYPVNFYAETSQDIYDYTKAFCDNTNLAVMLFQVPHWGFQRVHGSDIEPALIRRLIDDCPNIAAIKAEGGMPSIMGFVECHRLFGKEVVISCPLGKGHARVRATRAGAVHRHQQHRIFRPDDPAHLQSASEGRVRRGDQAVLADPAGAARQPGDQRLHGADSVLHRMQWKYQAWLNGFNGGPMRRPSMRVTDPSMAQLRSGLARAGIKPTELHDREFTSGATRPNPLRQAAGRSTRFLIGGGGRCASAARRGCHPGSATTVVPAVPASTA